MQLGLSSGAAIAREAGRSVPRHRGDDTRRRDLPDPVVPFVRDEQIPCPVHSHARGGVQLSVDCGAAITGIAAPRISSCNGENQIRIDLENALAGAEVEVTPGISRGDGSRAAD